MPEKNFNITIIATTLTLIAVGFALPDWLTFLTVSILAKALVVVGVAVLMRGGIVSFGQGLYYCIGAYAVGLGGKFLGITDLFGLMLLALIAGLVFGGLLGLLMKRYREIFFAMFSLALSMILFGVLSKSQLLGSTDGFTIVKPTFLGASLSTANANHAIYIFACLLSGLVIWLGQRYLRSPMGFAGEALRDNEVRVEYLGVAPETIIYTKYLIASVTASLGGGLMALTLGHIGPEMAYWSQSGEFIFIALLGGTSHIAASFVGTAVFEFIRTFALELAPNAWQIILGVVLIFIIIFFPSGIWSLFSSLKEKLRSKEKNHNQGSSSNSLPSDLKKGDS